MNLFTRTGTIARGKDLEALAFAVQVGEYVSNATGLEVNVWRSVYGQPLGTIIWSARVESMAAMSELGDRLEADPGYMEIVAPAVELFAGPPEDRMMEFVAAAGPGNPIGEVVSLIVAQCAGGHMADAMEWGVEMTHHVAEVTGLDTSFVRGLFGPWASVAWITLADSVASYEAGMRALSEDSSYLSRLDKAGDFFVPGSAIGYLSRRIN